MSFSRLAKFFFQQAFSCNFKDTVIGTIELKKGVH